jgi:hypothetical protein
MRGEATGPLPVPSAMPKRRYEATPSAVAHRPLAPHTDVDHVDHVEEARLAHKLKPQGSAMSPPPVQMRPAPDVAPDRNLGRYPPLAQASGSSLTTGAMMSEEHARGIRAQGGTGPPRIAQGPRMGYFTEERRDVRPASGSLAPSRAPELQPSPRVAAVPGSQPPELARLEPLPPQHLRPRADMHGPGQYQVLPQQSMYMQSQQQQGHVMASSHSRHTSLTAAPGSPVVLPKHGPDVSPIRRSSFGQGQPYFPYGIHQQSTVSPTKDLPRPSVTPAPPEPPRQIPAKRSNIMSILNDEPEEPTPRKRFASEQTANSPRMSYSGLQSVPQSSSSLRHEEKPSYLPASSHTPAPQAHSRPSYSDYSPYPPAMGSSSGGGPANSDWMARFDPRGQSQQPAEQSNVRSSATPSGFGGYAPPAQPASGSQPPTPSAATPHRGYQYPASHAQGAPTPPLLPTNSREPPPPVYRQASPPPRHNVLSYGSRPEVQSPANSLNIPPRQPSGPGPSYNSPSSHHPQATSPHPLGPQHRHSHSHSGHHHSYQQHVQAMVSGSQQQQQQQQQQPAMQQGSRPSMGLTGGVPYGHSTPPPQHASGHPPPPRPGSLAPASAGPPSMGIVGRPYTPPGVVHPPPPAPVLGGMPYPASGSGSGGQHMHPNSYSRGPGPEGGQGHPHGHHRVYSQGSGMPPR